MGLQDIDFLFVHSFVQTYRLFVYELTARHKRSVILLQTDAGKWAAYQTENKGMSFN